MRLLFVFLLIFYALPSYANEKPYQPICTVDARILSLDHGKFFYNEKDSYDYVEAGILKKSINVLQAGNDLEACFPFAEKEKTDVVRSWDWNNQGVLVYADGAPVKLQDEVRLTLTAAYVGDKAWPSIIRIERRETEPIDVNASDDLDCQEGSFVPLHYVYFNPDSHENEAAYIQGIKPAGPQEIERMIVILNAHHVGHKIIDSKIQISCAVWKDQDIMANYTEKSKDENWFKSNNH